VIELTGKSMLSSVVSLTIVVAATAANAVPAVNRPAIAADSLPSGSSEEFRRQMIDWHAVSPAPLVTKNRIGDVAVRVDRLALSSKFGWRRDPITGIERRHEGIDMPGRFGSAVMATAPGVVRLAGWFGGYGNLVEIEHRGGVRTRYGHLSRIEVVPRQYVAEGQVIGELGSTGHSTGPHLHYEVRIGGSAVDPLTFVGQRMSTVDTVWGAELHATSKWAWSTGSLDETLPEVSLR
jgi:murein DD-endopeptidase MepM/ murein hydrolase activator NlpD